METLKFGLLNWTNSEASFYWPAALGAKIRALRELKTTIQTPFCHSCSPYLYCALDSDCIFYWPATLVAKICVIRELKTTIQTPFCSSCSPYLYSAFRFHHFAPLMLAATTCFPSASSSSIKRRSHQGFTKGRWILTGGSQLPAR